MTQEKRLYLASSSFQRKNILEKMDLSFEVVHPCVDEILPEKGQGEKCVLHNALLKARGAFDLLDCANQKNSVGVIVAADTLVICGNEVFCKPKNREDSALMWQKYHDNEVAVVSGVSVMTCEGRHYEGVDRTDILFRSHRNSLETFFQDKYYSPYSSGGFTIEGMGSLFFDQIRGSYYNVLGLPVHLLVSLLDQLGIKIEDYVKKGCEEK